MCDLHTFLCSLVQIKMYINNTKTYFPDSDHKLIDYTRFHQFLIKAYSCMNAYAFNAVGEYEEKVVVKDYSSAWLCHGDSISNISDD